MADEELVFIDQVEQVVGGAGRQRGAYGFSGVELGRCAVLAWVPKLAQ